MGCKIRALPRSGKLALSLQWMLRGRSIRSQESLGVSDTARNRAIVQRDFIRPIEAEIAAKRFDEARYLTWFPSGSRASEFRCALGQVPGVAAPISAAPMTVGEYYARWIEAQTSPTVRPSRRRDYSQAMTAYVLPELADYALGDVKVGDLIRLRDSIIARGLKLKSARNIIDANFRAMWRDARNEELVESDPFARMSWPREKKERPDPFTIEERDRIIDWFAENKPHYHPLIAVLFLTGMRPSEAVALRVGDVDMGRGRVTVCRSRYLGHESATKTAASERTFPVIEEVAALLRPLVAGRQATDPLFRNHQGRPVNQSEWPKTHWASTLGKLNIRYRKWYATRHTFISIALSGGGEIFPVAKYAGTSVQMIEAHYASWIIRDEQELLSRINPGRGAKTRPVTSAVAFRAKKALRNKVSPTGFERVGKRARIVPIPTLNGKQIQCLRVVVAEVESCRRHANIADFHR